MKYVFEIDVIGDVQFTEFMNSIVGFKVERFRISPSRHPAFSLSTEDRQKAINFLAEYYDSRDDLEWVESQIVEVP